MRNYSLFFRNKDTKTSPLDLFRAGSGSETVSVAMFSDFFCGMSDNMFCTNSMYSDFKDSVIASIEVYSPKEEILLSIYESSESEEDKRDMLLIGFNKYIRAYYQKLRREYLTEIFQVSFFFVVGFLLIILGYSLEGTIPNWFMYCITNFGTVLIWQFVGYWAFEYAGQKRTLDRLEQIENLRYDFRKWE